ncbi:GntP family permease [Campylobacter hepaticus]|uniref:GntP family permease n=1 Tax=Campylobacter hepaticus TaxID=1813019 RepID=UPI0029B2963D|nr:GntP family permease [Campylobacter hepaticus]MDX2330869.1 GntP family permease [Campylobacter hepaticus]MDX2371525.1 GntP family permease [Campylobacter hepaticus]MDX2396775.1 GntP family permease [Campylobacter hepaticus]MDX5508683.1 GntP family permease [Campylobacter hepaticus]
MTGIILGLIILMVLAYLGWSIVWVGPIAAGVVALGGGLDLFDSYTNVYMGGFVAFAKTWFPVFMLGAIFGKLMELTYMASSVSLTIGKILGEKRAILGVILAAAILTYGGVSLFVVVFAVYPLALSLFKKANISKRLIPAAIALGAFTFTMAALPGSPQIQNLIPIKYFDTTAMAAPIMGIICGLIMFVGGYFYLKYRENYLKNLGEFYEESKDKYQLPSDEKIPHFILSLIPLLCVIILLNVFSFEIINALLCGIFAILLLNIHRFRNFVKAMNEGVQGSIIAIINTSGAVGFGSVVKAVPGFQTLTNLLLDFKINPLISEGIAVNLLAGATGSASGGLDALPHNGAVLTLLAITSMSHKKSYLDICVVAVIIPIIALIVGIILAYFGIY